MTREELEELKNVDVRTVNRDTLVDINTVKIDPGLPRKERIREYVRQIRNPYCYLDQGYVVKLSFADTDRTLEDCLVEYAGNAL